MTSPVKNQSQMSNSKVLKYNFIGLVGNVAIMSDISFFQFVYSVIATVSLVQITQIYAFVHFLCLCYTVELHSSVFKKSSNAAGNFAFACWLVLHTWEKLLR